MPMALGSIIIAAHNEQAVMARSLTSLHPLAVKSIVEVVVVCNGCTDETSTVARGFPGVTVIDLAVASKTAALRAGDRVVSAGPRLYLDADVDITAEAVRALMRALGDGGAVAGRPPVEFDTHLAVWSVRRWYEIRRLLPSITGALWGAGAYGLSQRGRAMFDEFPEIVSDDLFIHSLFTADEVVIVPTDPVVVHTPRSLEALLRVLVRTYRTQGEVDRAAPQGGMSSGQSRQLREIAAVVLRRPWLVGSAAIYVGIILRARVLARESSGVTRWERDESSRTVG